MSSFSRQFVAALAASLLVVGCSHLTPSPSTTAVTKPAGAHLSETDAIRIAGEAAVKRGYRLADYNAPQVHYEFTRKARTWSVFYDGCTYTRVPFSSPALVCRKEEESVDDTGDDYDGRGGAIQS